MIRFVLNIRQTPQGREVKAAGQTGHCLETMSSESEAWPASDFSHPIRLEERNAPTALRAYPHPRTVSMSL